METDNVINDNEMGGLSILAQGINDPGNLAVQGGVYTDILGTNTIGGTLTIKNKLLLDPSITVGIDANSCGIVNLSDPISSGDAANKGYIDTMVNNLSQKNSVIAATTVSGTLSSSFQNGSVIDNVTLVTGYRILVKNQTNAIENGIYIVNASGAPTRALDFDSGLKVSGSFVFVEQGTINTRTLWLCNSAYSSDTVGTHNITFSSLFASPTPIGSITPNTGAFTTLQVSGQITSTVSSGTAPFVVSSDTVVTNLNASKLLGATWSAPLAIGSTMSNTGKFSYLNIDGSVSGTIGIGNTSGNYTLDLPATLGITGQFLTLANNTGTLKWGFPITWIISDQKSSGTNSGSFTSGAWRTRTLNTISSSSSSSDVTLSSNQITMVAGTYSFNILAPAYSAGSHACRLYNVSNSTVVDVGTSEFSGGGLLGTAIQSSSSLYTVFTISSTTVFRVEHRCTTTSNTDGFGLQTGLQTEVYAVCRVTKLI